MEPSCPGAGLAPACPGEVRDGFHLWLCLCLWLLFYCPYLNFLTFTPQFSPLSPPVHWAKATASAQGCLRCAVSLEENTYLHVCRHCRSLLTKNFADLDFLQVLCRLTVRGIRVWGSSLVRMVGSCIFIGFKTELIGLCNA